MKNLKLSLRKQLAQTDSLLCKFFPELTRHQVALDNRVTATITPVDAAKFRYLSNVDWWIHVWAPSLDAQMPAGCRWIVLDLDDGRPEGEVRPEP
jgi:hypothetical protein